MAEGFDMRSRPASGKAGTNMCIASVPVNVSSTRSQSGGTPPSADADDAERPFALKSDIVGLMQWVVAHGRNCDGRVSHDAGQRGRPHQDVIRVETSRQDLGFQENRIILTPVSYTHLTLPTNREV